MTEEFDQDVNCSRQEQERRIEFCGTCDRLDQELIPRCKECNCSISMLSTYKFKTCPIGKW